MLTGHARVHGEHGEQRRHELRAADDVRDRFHVHRMDREQQPSDERARRVHPAPGERRHGHRGPGVPQEVHGVEPGGSVHERIEGKSSNHQRPVHMAAQIRGPVRRGERPPQPRRVDDERVQRDDRDVVQGEPIPEGAEVDDHGAQRDRQKHPLGSHLARARNESAAAGYPRVLAIAAAVR